MRYNDERKMFLKQKSSHKNGYTFVTYQNTSVEIRSQIQKYGTKDKFSKLDLNHILCGPLCLYGKKYILYLYKYNISMKL